MHLHILDYSISEEIIHDLSERKPAYFTLESKFEKTLEPSEYFKIRAKVMNKKHMWVCN